MKSVFDELIKEYERYSKALQKYDSTAADGASLVQQINTRIRDERRENDARIKELEEQLKDSPREQLRQIDETIIRAEERKNQNAAEYWVNSYRGVHDSMHDNDIQKLKKKRDALIRDIALAPAFPGEVELYELRKLEYSVTPEENARIDEAKERLEAANEALWIEREKLRSCIKAAKQKMETIGNEVGAFQTGNQITGFNDIIEKLDKLRGAKF